MKGLVKLLVILLVLAVAFPAGPALAAKKYERKTMNVYLGITPHAREQVMQYIAPKLKAKWGINLAAEAIGSGAMLEKILVQKKNPRISVAGWDVVIGVKAAKLGLCETIDIEKAPNLKKLYDWALNRVDGKLQVLATSVSGVGLIYNEELFKKKNMAPATSWYDLWRKDLSGRISITAPESTWGTAALVTIARLEGGGEHNIDPGFKKLRTLLPYIHTIHTWSSELTKLLQLGEVWLGTTGSNMGVALREKGFPARWVAPREGAPMMGGGMSLIKNAPLQEVAYDFLNLYFSTEFQKIRIGTGNATSNKEAWESAEESVKASFPVRPDRPEKLIKLDWTIINEKRAAWTERWHKEMK
ncbi:MAG: extracellular solute-binding protein [Deltaproteobacteria bacterium]|nr:extracellular solute-binding protein [Deltaproteobacteria bacterium]